MHGLLKYTDLDVAIQTRMSNQAPGTTTRLQYINDFMFNLLTEYDIEVARKSVTVELTPNGEPVDIDTLITDLDVKKIKDIRQTDPELRTDEYRPLNEDAFSRNYASGRRLNQWAFYTENGKRYLKLNSSDKSDNESADYKITYYTTNLAMQDGDYIPQVVNASDCYLLIPQEYKEMAVSGIVRFLFTMSLGADGNQQASIHENKYKSKLNKFGLNKEGTKIRTDENTIKLHSLM
jgi:hypothetical protein